MYSYDLPIRCTCAEMLAKLEFLLQSHSFYLPCISQLLIPKECPVADDVDYEHLAIHEMTGGHIKSAIFRAAARAALRKEEKRILTEEDLKEACEEECGKSGTSMSFRRQTSGTQGMYN